MEETAKIIWNEIQTQGIRLNIWAYIFIAGISILTSIITSYAVSYFQKRAEEDVIERYFHKTLDRLVTTTKVAKEAEESIHQHFSFIERQLNEFYSPLLCSLKYVRTLGQIRVKIENVVNSISMQEYQRSPEFYDNRYKYDNKQHEEIILPVYEKMLAIFTEKYWLSEESTKNIIKSFVNLWRFGGGFMMDCQVIELKNLINEKVYLNA